MARLRAVLFDYGHTLIDFAPAEDNLLVCYAEVRQILQAEAEREIPEAPELIEALSRQVGAMVTESYRLQELQELDIVSLYDRALQTMGHHLPGDLIRRIAEIEHRALLSDLVMSPVNLEVLRELRAMGLELGLVSNATFLPELMHEDIRRLGIEQLMDSAIFSSEAGVRKPHPAIYQRVLADLEVPPEEALFVGDRLYDDLSGAQALGMRGVLTREFRQEDPEGNAVKPDFVIERLPELVPIVSRLREVAASP